MEPLSLKCPFCCEETFSSHLALKYHILSIFDNILCPACNCRFDTIMELIEHLDRECKDQESNTELIAKDHIKTESEDFSITSKDIRVDNDQQEDEATSGDCLLKTAVDGNDEEYETPTFLCEMCNMQFESVEEHLEEFHEGEDVILVSSEFS